jgi:MoaA/NifB/PqqE/SkfB family radical SAM enzyme
MLYDLRWAYNKLIGRARFHAQSMILARTSLTAKDSAAQWLIGALGGILVQNSSICNARCIFCAYRHLPNRGQVMPDAVFDETVKQFVKSGGGHFGFLPVVGEPTTDPNLLSRIARVKALPCTHRVSLTTNGILLDRFGVEQVLTSGVDTISISTSGFDELMYQRVYGSDQYGRMFGNVVHLLETNRLMGEPVYIEIEVRSDRPVRETVDTADYQRIRALTDRIHFLRYYDNWGGLVTKDDLSGSMRIKKPRSTWHSPCKALLWSPMVFAGGDVGACSCRDAAGTSSLRLGNVITDDLATIWRGPKRQGLFKSFEDGYPPKICKGCSRYIPWDQNLLATIRTQAA